MFPKDAPTCASPHGNKSRVFFWNEPRKASISDKYATQHSCSPWMSIPVTVTLFAKFGPTLSKRVQESPASDEEKVPTWMILRSIQYVNCSRGLALSRRSVFPLEAVKAHFTLQKSSYVPVRYTGADLGAPHMLRNFWVTAAEKKQMQWSLNRQIWE